MDTSLRDGDQGGFSAGPIESLLWKASRIGIDPNTILSECNLPFTMDDLAGGRTALLSRSQRLSIVRWIAENAVKAFSTPAARKMQKRDFDLFCFGCLQCETLEEAIIRQIDFLALFNGSSGRLGLRARDGMAALEIEIFDAEPDWKAFFLFNAFSVFRRLFAWLIGEDLEQLEYRTTLAAAARADARILLPVEQVRFGAARNEMCFRAAQLKRKIIRSYRDCAELAQHFPYELERGDGVRCWSRDVLVHYKMILMRDQGLPTIPTLAAALGLGGATLRRRLAQERTSIQTVKDQARRELAVHYLGETRLSVDDISARLGFSCSKSLARAFKSWTGLTPSGFRQSRSSGFMPEPGDVADERRLAH